MTTESELKKIKAAKLKPPGAKKKSKQQKEKERRDLEAAKKRSTSRIMSKPKKREKVGTDRQQWRTSDGKPSPVTISKLEDLDDGQRNDLA
jgi:hypothetical protein